MAPHAELLEAGSGRLLEQNDGPILEALKGLHEQLLHPR